MDLMIARAAGVAVGRGLWGRRGVPGDRANSAGPTPENSQPSDASRSESVGLTNDDIDKRFMEAMRLRRSASLTRFLPG